MSDNFEWMLGEAPPPIESHTSAKLKVLRSYLRAYFAKLTTDPRRQEFKLALIDGFSGGGVYQDGSEIISGSPLIMLEETEAAETRVNSSRRNPLRFNFKFYFSDIAKPHIDYLKKSLSERGYRVDGSKINIWNESFDKVIERIIAQIKTQQPQSGRAIFLLDQKGFSQVKLSMIAEIFKQLRNAEVILTLAAETFANIIVPDDPGVKAATALNFSREELKTLVQTRERDRALAQRMLREHLWCQIPTAFFTPFFIRPRVSRRALWFLHFSQHATARDVMIQCHWDITNTFEHYGPGGFEMLGWEALKSEILPIFRFEDDSAVKMRGQLLEKMPSKLYDLLNRLPILTVQDMHCRFANETPAKFSDLDKVAINLAAEHSVIQIANVEGKIIQPRKQLRVSDRLVLPPQRMFSFKS